LGGSGGARTRRRQALPHRLPNLPPPELNAGIPAEGKEGGGREFFSSRLLVKVGARAAGALELVAGTEDPA